ncbi:MAG TPA: ATP synthase F0 subunit C [Armatimonadota bacterium]|jgi:F-type H+-transporting ATPase subunit c
MLYFALFGIGVALGLPLAVFGAALGQGKIGAAAMEGIARQPEAAGRLQTAMIIGLALIESLVIYVLLTFFMMQGKLPKTEDILEAIKSQPAATSVNR